MLLFIHVLLAILAAAIAVAFVRVILGRSVPDRIVALDLIATLTVAVAGLYSIAHQESAFLDLGIILALVNFVSTVAFATYLERAARS